MFQPIFRVKKFEEESLGSYLRNGREMRKIKLTKLASEIAVSVNYVRAIENGDYSVLPPEIYVKGFIRRYCNVVGLDYQKASYLFSKNKSRPAPPLPKKSPIAHTWFLQVITYRNLVLLIGLLFLTTLLFYLLNVIYPMYSKPFFRLLNPVNCPVEASADKFELLGVIQPEGKIWINEEESMVDKEGNFTCSLFLRKGENNVNFRIVNKFGKERTEECVIRKD